ncbi:MAG: hypothetical protein F4234_10570 [Gammaproteobacteria bacterium]|nr:hypothetical protein [Gammaproteobacteria bacterium]
MMKIHAYCLLAALSFSPVALGQTSDTSPGSFVAHVEFETAGLVFWDQLATSVIKLAPSEYVSVGYLAKDDLSVVLGVIGTCFYALNSDRVICAHSVGGQILELELSPLRKFVRQNWYVAESDFQRGFSLVTSGILNWK